MGSVYSFKPRFQALLRPAAARMAKAGVTANQVTLATLVLSIGLGAFVAVLAPARWPWLLIGPFLLIRMALNAIDGMLAREFGRKTRLGALLNELGDVISDAALYLPLGLAAGVSPGLIAVFVALAVIAEMAGVLGVMVDASRRYDGPMGKSDRALWLGAATFLVGMGMSVGNWFNGLVCILCALLVWTVVNRARRALREAERVSRGR